MVEKSITGIVTWLKNWFYDSSQIDGMLSTINSSLNNKVNVNQGDGNANMNVVTDASGSITVENKPNIPSASSSTPLADVSGGAVGTGTAYARADHKHPLSSAYATSGHNHTGTYAPLSHNQATSTITNASAFDNILSGESTTLTLDTQAKINSAINTRLGEISDIKALEFVSSRGTASESTMGKLYVVNEDSKINFYWTKRSGSSGSYTYEWEKMDTDILDELVVNWSDVQNKPSTFIPSSHTHGNLGNDGKMTDTKDTSLTYNTPILRNNSTNEIYSATYLWANLIKDTSAHSNIDSSANATQTTINTKIDTALGNKGAKTDDIDWSYNSNGFVNGIKLHDKTATGDDATGTITFHLKS